MRPQKIKRRNQQQHFLLSQKRPVITDKKALLRGLGTLMMLGILLTGTVLFYVWSRLEVVRLNYAILEASKEEKRLYLKNERFKVELATLMSPSRLSHLATTRFQLQNPKKSQIIYMTE